MRQWANPSAPSQRSTTALSSTHKPVGGRQTISSARKSLTVVKIGLGTTRSPSGAKKL